MKQVQKKDKIVDLSEELSILITRRDKLRREVADLENKFDRTEKQISKVENMLNEQKETLVDSQNWIIVENSVKPRGSADIYLQKTRELSQSEEKRLHKTEEVERELKNGLLKGGSPKDTLASTFLKVIGIFTNDESLKTKPEVTNSSKKDRKCFF